VSTTERRTVGLMTVGCKLNQYETEGLAELLESAGYTVVSFREPADVYVVNTCTVTGRSDYRSRQMLRRAARTNPAALVVAAGCYAQRDAEALAAMPEVGLVVGQSSKRDVVPLIASILEGTNVAPDGRSVVDVRPHETTGFQSFDIEGFRGYTRAFLKIQDGCDRRCSYCAVPDARGPARSRPAKEVVEQARRLAANGYREIVLTGVHIGTYGEGSNDPRLAELLSTLSSIDDLVRIRLGSVEPRELTPALALEILTNPKVANHLHVPLQSGSDRVLSAMRRGYTRSEYVQAVRAVTDADPRCGLGADVMVGFPGETDEDFADTVSLLESLPVTYLHVFSFSPRPGTDAALMKGEVPGLEKRRRSNALRELGERKSLAFRRGLPGSRHQVLVEEGSDDDGRMSGLAGNYVRVDVGRGDELENRFMEVEIEGADEARTWGHVVREVCPR
jgi:threonylcarbamoyladenosine tRNA methylthiotransferase MtaB